MKTIKANGIPLVTNRDGTNNAKPVSQHTPGPWKVIHEDNDSNRVVVRGVCEVWPTSNGTASKLATANLIAAAPELLAALKSLRDNHADAWHAEELAEVEAAIAKAEGAQ